MVTDRGPCFHSHEFVSFCDTWGIKLKLLSGFNPQANGQIEVYNKYIGQYLRIVADEPKQWASLVQPWTYAIN